MFDVLIIGGGGAGMSCALVLGSAKNKSFVSDKKIGIIAHQKTSSLQEALFNNAYGIAPGTLGTDLLQGSIKHLSEAYPHIEQITEENNSITKGFTSLGIENKNAFDSQALIQLKNEYCNQKRCLECAVGNKLLRPVTSSAY